MEPAYFSFVALCDLLEQVDLKSSIGQAEMPIRYLIAAQVGSFLFPHGKQPVF